MVFAKPPETSNQQLMLLGKVCQELLATGHWSAILKEKLEQLQDKIAEVHSSDFSAWTEKMIIYWKRYAALKPELTDLTSLSPPLLTGDSWKIVITSNKIVVFSGGETKSIEYNSTANSNTLNGDLASLLVSSKPQQQTANDEQALNSSRGKNPF